MQYKISQNSIGISVRQYSFSSFASGVIFLLLGFVMRRSLIQSGATDFTGIETLDYIFPRFFWLFWMAGAGYLVFFVPYLIQVIFSINLNELELKKSSLMRKKNKKYMHKGMESLFVKDVGTDGSWYAPLIVLESGDTLEIGFGCPSDVSAKSVSEEIKFKYNNVEDNKSG